MGEQKKVPRLISLKPITACTPAQQECVRQVRNQPSVRSSMYTDHIITRDEHLRWIDRLRGDEKQLIFAVLNEENHPIGVVSANAIDSHHNKTDWAFYLDDNQRGGLGAALEYHFIEFVFNELNMEKLNCEVIETNDAVVKMHKRFAFQEEGFRRSNITKDGKRIGVFLLGLTKDDWLSNRQQLSEKYESTLSKFVISIAPSWRPIN